MEKSEKGMQSAGAHLRNVHIVNSRGMNFPVTRCELM